MTVNRGLFVKQLGAVGTSPLEARRALAGLFVENSPGTPRSGLLEPATPTLVSGTANMSYDIGACVAVVNRSATEGVYLFGLHGTTNVPTTAAPGTDKRWDLIWIKQNDPEKSDTVASALSNTGIAGVVQGTAAIVPAKPTSGVPAGALVVGEALVSAGATATNQASVTITQVWPYAGLRGAPLWVRDSTERDTITPHLHQKVYNLSTGFEERWNGTGWASEAPQLRYASFYGTQAAIATNTVWGPGMPGQEAGRSINGGFVSFSENDWLSVNEQGLYTIDVMVEIAGGFGNGGFVALQNLQGQTLATTAGQATTGGLSCSKTLWLSPGTTTPAGVVKVLYYQTTGSNKAATFRVSVAKIA